MSGPKFSVICATLLRPSYASLVWSVRAQSFPDFEFLGRNDPGNEYIARNRAAATARGEWLVFTDDDVVMPPGYLSRLAALIDSRPDLVAVTGPLRGNMWGQGTMLLNESGWWIGANLAVRRDVFLERPFEETWGLDHTPRGWRADTDFGFSIEDRYPDRWAHDQQLVVDHPGPMGSVWQPDVEAVFFRRWRQKVMERFVPVDPRLQEFLLTTQDLSPSERERVVKCRRAIRQQIPALPVLAEEKDGAGGD